MMSEPKPVVTIDDIDAFINDPQNAELAEKISEIIKDLRTFEVADHLMARVMSTKETPNARKRILLIVHHFMPDLADNFDFYKKVFYHLRCVIETFQWDEAVFALNNIAKFICGTDLHVPFLEFMIRRAKELYANGQIAIVLQLIKSLEGIIDANNLIDFIKQYGFTEEGIKLCLTILDSSPGINSVSYADYSHFILNHFFSICPSECSKILCKIDLQIDYSINQELVNLMWMSPAAYHIARLGIRLSYNEIHVIYVIQVIMMNLEQVKSVEALDNLSDEGLDKDLKRDLEDLFALIQKVSDAIDDLDKEKHFHSEIEKYWSTDSFKLAAALLYGFVCRNKNIIPETSLLLGFDKDTKFMLAAMFNIEEKMEKYVERACEHVYDEDINNREAAYTVFSRLRSQDLVQQVFNHFTEVLSGIEEVDPDKLPEVELDPIELTLRALDALPAGFEMSSDVLNKMMNYYLRNKINHHFVHYLLRIQSKFNNLPDPKEDKQYFSYVFKLYREEYIDAVLILYRNNKLQLEQCNYNFSIMFEIIERDDFEMTRQDSTWILGMCKYGGQFYSASEYYVKYLTKQFVKTSDNEVAKILLVGTSLIYEGRYEHLRGVVREAAEPMMEQTRDIDFSDISPEDLLTCFNFVCQYEANYIDQILITLISKNIKTAFEAFNSIPIYVALKKDVMIALDQSIEKYKDDNEILRNYSNLKNSRRIKFI